MPSICHNTDWWVLEAMKIFDAHLISEEANTIRFKNNILILKEEGDSSSTNQAYDKYVAKEDKHIQRKNLNFIRESRQRTYNITDKCGQLNCGLAAVQHTTMHLQQWVNSFIAVNLKPTERIPFEEWCRKIAAHMQSSDSFDLVQQNNNNIEKYLLLPDTWQEMSTEHKTTAVDILKKHGGNAWGVECFMKIANTVCVTLS